MGVRFSGTFKPWIDDFGLGEIQVEIKDKSGGGNQPIRIASVNVFTETEAREPLSVIKGARCEVTFLIEDASYASFIDELANQVEDRFHLTLENLNYIFFAGAVVHEFTDYEDAAYPYFFTVNAVDGIARMRDIDYVDDDGESFVKDINPYLSAMDHIFNCFQKLQLENIYGTAYDLQRIWVQCDWYATNMANTSDNPLEQAYIDGEVFYDYDNDGNLLPMKCYDVLEEILKAFGLSITYGRGIYRIDQYSSRQPERDTYWLYNFDGTLAGTRLQHWKHTIDQVNIMAKATGTFSYLAALRQVKVNYKYRLGNVAIEPDATYGFGGSVVGGAGLGGKVCYVYQTPHLQAGLLRPLKEFNLDGVQNPLRFRVTFQLMLSTTFDHYPPSDWVNHKFIFRVYLRIDAYDGTSKAISRPITITGYDRWTIGEEEWLDEGAAYSAPGTEVATGGWDILTEPLMTSGNSPTTKYLDLGFETQPVDIGAGLGNTFKPYVCVELYRVFTENGAPLTSEYTHEWAISDLTVIYGLDNNKAKPQYETVEAVSSINEGGTGDKVIELIIGDRGSSLKVDNGSDLIEPGGWGVGGGGSDQLPQLLADEYHKIRGKPIKLTTRTIIGRQNLAIDSLGAFYYCDLYWLALQTNHDFNRQEITGTWWNHIGNFTAPGATKTLRAVGSDYNRIDERPDLYAGNGKAEAHGRDGDGFTAPTTDFLIDTDNFVLPLTSDYDADAINKIVDVYVNGNKLEYIDVFPGSQGNTWYTINNVNNSIVLSDNFPLSARHWIQVFIS